MNLKSFFICLFSFLAKLGLRKYVIQTLAFFPPELPTYTFRKLNNQSQKSKNLETQDLLQPLTPKTYKSKKTDDSKDQTNKSILRQMDDESMRFHRISSFLIDLDLRPYLVSGNEQGIDSKQSQVRSNEEFKVLFAQSKQPHKLMLITKSKFVVDLDLPDDLHVSGYYLNTSSGNVIATLLVQNTLVKSDYILLHSHQNTPDIGVLLDTYLDLAFNLSITVIGYDYSGFGQSTGQPHDVQCIDDIQTVYQFIIKELGFPSSKIILYGQSIGSGPTIALASNPNYPVSGLIIHSGFTSGLRVFNDQIQETKDYDIFPNIDLIERINCLIYIIHGKDDLLVCFEQGIKLAEKSKLLFKIWLVEQAGHNNIELAMKFRKDYFQNLKDFLKVVQNISQGISAKNFNKIFSADNRNSMRSENGTKSLSKGNTQKVKSDTNSYSNKNSKAKPNSLVSGRVSEKKEDEIEIGLQFEQDLNKRFLPVIIE